eukprot:2836283-Amphidinium_carterae.1
MPRPGGPYIWNDGMTWDEQIVEYNRLIVDYLDMTVPVQTAYRKTVLFPIINRLGSRESKVRSKVLTKVLRHGDRNFPKNRSGRYSSCDIWSVFRREFDSPQMLVAMTIPLGNDKSQAAFSLVGLKVAVLECTHGHSIQYEPSVTSVTVLSPEMCQSLGPIVHGTVAHNEVSIRQLGLKRDARGDHSTSRTSVHFAAYKHAGGTQSYHDYGLNVYLKAADLI